MKMLKDMWIGLLPPDREKQVLQAFVTVTKTLAQGTGKKTVDQIVANGQEVEPTTGLSRQILLNQAISDFASPEGRLLVIFKKSGKALLASFFEKEIETDKGRRVILGVVLNLDAKVKFGGSDNFEMSEPDVFSVSEALVEAMVVFDRRGKEGETALILKRNENPEVLN